MRAIGDKVVMTVIKSDNTTKSGIFIKQEDEVIQTAKVISVGSNVTGIKEGDKVLIHKLYNREVQDYVVQDQDTILAILED